MPSCLLSMPGFIVSSPPDEMKSHCGSERFDQSGPNLCNAPLAIRIAGNYGC